MWPRSILGMVRPIRYQAPPSLSFIKTWAPDLQLAELSPKLLTTLPFCACAPLTWSAALQQQQHMLSYLAPSQWAAPMQARRYSTQGGTSAEATTSAEWSGMRGGVPASSEKACLEPVRLGLSVR